MADQQRDTPEALQMENPKRSEEDEDMEDGGEELEEGGSGGGELQSPESEVGDTPTETQSETLEVAEKDQSGGDGLQANSSMKSNDRAQSEERNGVPHEKVVPVATVDDAEAQMRNYQKSKVSQTTAMQGVDVQTENQHRLVVCPTLSQLSPTSVTQPISSASSPTRKENDLLNLKEEQQNASAHKPVTPLTITRVPSSDGYNWRKYGQKQVKSPKGSRGYFKCTYSECYAKKIECCDHSGYITEIVYKSQHTHDPPKKPSSARDKAPSLKKICNTPKDSDPSTSAKETTHETPLLTDRKRPLLASPDEKNSIVLFKDEHANEPEPKRRLKKSQCEYSDSLMKPNKKPKFVVHAAGDVGISGDGYRWRKYGQKMVKGNPHPRNYYRCTSAGCPVRKYIETAVENTSAVIITYKGVHDHAMPVPKKRHGPPSAPLIAASAPASLQLKKPEKAQSQSQTKWSVGDEGELTGEDLDLGSEKAIESARTLLSIGFEIKPC